MITPRRLIELLVLGLCAFLLTQAILSLILSPGNDPNEGSVVTQLILSASYLSVLGILIPYYRQILFVLARNKSLVLLVLWAILSSTWSVTPPLSFRRAMAMLGTTVFGIALALRLSPEQQVRFLSWLCRIIAVLSLACVLFLPAYGIAPTAEEQWQGIFGYKSVLGFIMSLSILVEWHLPTPTPLAKILNWVALLLSGLLLYRSNSLTPTIAMVGALILVQLYKVAVQRLGISLPVTALLIGLVALWAAALYLANSDNITKQLGRSSDLTGRTEIWGWVGQSIAERPILGYGFSGFWSAATATGLDRALGGQVMYAHNGYLEVFLNLGIIGFAFTIIFLLVGMRRVLHWSDRAATSVNLWPLTLLIFFLIQNFTECSILLQDPQWAICVAVIVSTDPALLPIYDESDEPILLQPSEQMS